MTMLKKLGRAIGKLQSRIKREFEYLSHVFQGLIFITILDEFCYVKLTNKRELMKSIISRRHYRY
jgi:hypothetical protein